MPNVIATYGDKRSIGSNLADRNKMFALAFGDARTNLRVYADGFARWLDALKNEGGRSAFSCAEADALSGLLMQLTWQARTDGTHFEGIVFSRAVGEGGSELWHPCANCQAWLEEAGGWGPDKTYKLNATALSYLQPVKRT